MDYQSIKKDLADFAKQAKRDFRGDLPAICEAINNHADYLSRENFRRLSDTKRLQYEGYLSSYVCALHPKR